MRELSQLLIVALVALSSGALAKSAQAQMAKTTSSSECLPILTKDHEEGTSDVLTTLALLDREDRQEFEQRSRAAGVGVDFVYDGLPFKGNANWSDFQTAKENYKRSHRVDYSNAERRTWLVQRTTDVAFERYTQCLARSRETGVYLYFHFLQDTYLKGIIHVDFYPQDDKSHTLYFYADDGIISGMQGINPSIESVTIEEKSPQKAFLVKGLKGDQHFEIIFSRTSASQSTAVTAKGSSSAYGDSVEIVKEPLIEEYKSVQDTTIAKEYVSPLWNERSYDRGTMCLRDRLPSAVQDWRFVSESSEGLKTIALNGCNGCKPEIWLDHRNEEDVCYSYKNEGTDAGGAVTFKVQARARRFDWAQVRPPKTKQ